METDITEIKAKVRALSPEDKAQLMRELIAELDGAAEADVARAWIEEAKRRHQELESGALEGVAGERVFANLRARLGG